MTKIRFSTPRWSFDAVLNDDPVADEIVKQLPLEGTTHLWGDEIFFEIPVSVPHSIPTHDLQVGDIAYSPDGPFLCIFFGPTPASGGLHEPRPANAVTIVGRTDATPTELRFIEQGIAITVERA